MIMGVVFAQKRYPLAKYFCVLLISLGVGLFIYKDSKNTKKSAAADNEYMIGLGELFLVRILQK